VESGDHLAAPIYDVELEVGDFDEYLGVEAAEVLDRESTQSRGREKGGGEACEDSNVERLC
jgi:hypothetical protein